MDPQLAAMEAASAYGEPVPPPQAEVDDFLRKKRKAREHKACYPCRQRKVKCDLTRPCQTCRDRDHPELCSYHPPNNKRQNVDGNTPSTNPLLRHSEDGQSAGAMPGPGFVTLGRNEFEMLCHKLNGLEDSIAELKHEIRRNRLEQNGQQDSDNDSHQQQTHTDLHGLHAKNQSGEIVWTGGGSVPAMLYALSQGQAPTGTEQTQLQEFLGKSVLPLFGLDNESATYPFVDLWGLPHGSLQRAKELAKALPGDAQMETLFQSYKDMGYIIYPGIADISQLETDMNAFLAARGSMADPEDGVSEQMIYGKTYYWLGMLFAVLASGAQCSALSRKERELTSQVYVCCGFECLRFTNFLSQPHIESIQALLLIGNVMTNNMNAGTAWSLLGLTIRLAQGLGLHQACPPGASTDVIFPRSNVWWAIIWQDSLLSITYDRNAALDVGHNTMPMPPHFGHVSSYHASMYRMCKIVLEIVRHRARSISSREHVTRINQHREDISGVMRDASEHLRDSRVCKTSQETLEHWALYLHTSYAMSELCRPALSPRTSAEVTKSFRHVCIENLINVVEAFLGLNNLTFFARQSWAAVHRALSSALLLGIVGEHLRNERARSLIGAFVTLMAEVVAAVDPTEISAPVQRGIGALRKLNVEELQPWNANLKGFGGLGGGGGGAGAMSSADGIAQIFSPDAAAAVVASGSSEGALGTAGSGTSAADADEDSPYSVLNTILWGGSGRDAGMHGELQFM